MALSDPVSNEAIDEALSLDDVHVSTEFFRRVLRQAR
jgi:hypothetical protein